MGLLTNADHEQRLRAIETRLAAIEELQNKFITAFKAQDERIEAEVNLIERLRQYVDSLEESIRDLENKSVKADVCSTIEGEVRSSVQAIIAAGKVEAMEDLFNKVLAVLDVQEHKMDSLKNMCDTTDESVQGLYKDARSNEQRFVDLLNDFQKVLSEFQKITKIVSALAEKQDME